MAIILATEASPSKSELLEQVRDAICLKLLPITPTQILDGLPQMYG